MKGECGVISNGCTPIHAHTSKLSLSSDKNGRVENEYDGPIGDIGVGEPRSV